MDIAAGYTALTSAFEIAKGLKNIDDRVKLNAAVIELQEKILSAQQAATDAKARMQDLERKIDELDTWAASAQRYALKDFGCQTYAYQSKDETLNGEPPHLACPNCFRSRTISILQYEDTYYGRKKFNCLACEKSVELGCVVVERGSVTVDGDFDLFRR